MKRLVLSFVSLLALSMPVAAQTTDLQGSVALFQKVRTVPNQVYVRANGWEGKLDVHALRYSVINVEPTSGSAPTPRSKSSSPPTCRRRSRRRALEDSARVAVSAGQAPLTRRRCGSLPFGLRGRLRLIDPVVRHENRHVVRCARSEG